MRRSAVITVLLAAGALAGPSGQRTEHRCAAYCLTTESNKFSYTPGQTYQYSLRSTVRTDLEEDQHEISALEVTAQADIVANSACDLTLRLRDVTLKESDPEDEDNRQTVEDMNTFKAELERHPLSFSYQDGRVEELCAARTESVWALNFKRGLLSAIVNNMVSLERNEANRYEMDVSGYCATGYTKLPPEEVNSTLILRRKDLRTCRERGRLISSLQTVPYHSASKVQSPPLLQSTQECWQTVSDGRIRYVFCSEMHKFQPFSRGLTGARSLVTLELAETGVVPSQLSRAQGTETTRENIMFDHSAPTLTAESSAGDMQNLVSELERLSVDDVRPEVPHLFSRLVATLRHVGVDDLRLVLRDGSGRPRRYILDALPMLGTAAGITLMREMMLDGLVATEQSDRWMTSLALAQQPGLAMVEAAAPLVEFRNVSSQTLLGVSAMVHHFCRRDDDCARHEVVTRIVKNIEALLGDNCGAVTHEDRVMVLAALKALGNVGILVDGSTVLSSCYKNQEDIEIRLAAIRAYRRANCETIASSGFMSTLANQRENTEIRIAAYLAIMQCPTHGVVDKLLELLGKEAVNQVGSFIWTHITNMQESNDPGKDYIKSLLYNAELSKKFRTDARKFSRYYEKTLFFESVNAGGTVEGDVIFSPDSYIPRSGMLNLTVDLFGDSINLLEVGGRVEGVEKYIEQLLINDGSHPQTALGKVLSTIRGSDSSNDINRLSNPYMKANGDAGVFSASTYAKIFGNELHFANYENVDELIRSMQGDNPLSFLKALGQERDWSENYQFLDSSYTVPTIAGFPLTLNAVGSTAVTIKTGGAFTFESWNKMHAEGYIKPSAAVEIVGGMEVDAHVAKTGLKMTANLHTSTALDGHAVIDSGKLVSIKVNMPRDKVEFFDLKTDFHRVFRNQDRVLELNPRSFVLNRYGDCSYPYIGDPLGINACFSMSYPLPREPLPRQLFRVLGPIRATLLMEKTDISIDAFTLEYTNSNHDGVMQSSLTFDTPGGRQNRRVSLGYMLDIPEKAFHVELVSPIKSLELSGGMQLTGTEKFANVQVRLDDREVFGVKGSLTTEDSVAAVRLRPKLVVRGTSGPLFSISGNLNMNKAKHKYAVDLAISDLYENPVTLSGTIDESNGMYTVSTSMDSYALKGSVIGACRFNENGIEFRSNTRYSVFDGPQHTIAFNTKIWEEVEEAQHAYMAILNTKFSALPVLDSELSLKVTSAARRLGGRASLVHGLNEYLLSGELSNRHGQRSGMVAFQADHLDVDFRVALNLDTSARQKFEMNALAQLSQDRSVRGGLIVDYLSESYDFNYGIHTYVALMNSNYSLSTSVSRDTDSLDFAFLASRLRSSRAESKSISLMAQLAVSPSAGRSLDISLQLPGYPTIRLIGQLASGGSGGRYLASGELQHGARIYLTSAEYRYTDQHELELQAHLPDQRYSGTLAARTEKGNVKLKADLRLGRRIMSVVSLRPGSQETNANFELFWNKDIDDSQHILIDFKKTKSEIESRLRYPGRDIKLAARQTPEGGYAELELSPGKTIALEGSVRMQEDGRLSATLDVRTPFPGYTEMALTYTNRPDPTDEPSLLNFQVAGHIEDQEIVLDGRLVINFSAVQSYSRTKGNNLKAELNLTTPFTGWERSQFVADYLQNAHGVNALLSASKNDEVIAFGVTFEKLQVPEFFSINTAVDFALPVDRVRKGKLGFVLVLEDSHLLSNTTVEWTGEDTNQLSMDVECRYTMTPDLLVDSHVTFKTPFENMEQLDTHLHLGKTKQKLVTSFKVLRNEAEELLGTYLGGTKDYRSGFFSGEFDFACASCPGFGVALEYKPAVDASSFNLTTYWKEHKSELTGATSSVEGGGREYSLTLLLPNPNRRYALKNVFHADMDENRFSNKWEVSRDNQTVKIDLSSTWDIESHTDNSSSYILKNVAMITSPFLGWESAKVIQEGTLHTSDSVLDIKSNMILLKESEMIAVENRVHFYNWASWTYRHHITGNTGWFSKIEDLIKLDLQSSSKEAIYKTTWDGQTAKATLVDNLAQDGDYEMFMTAQWFGQPERRLSLIMPATVAAWSPSLTVLYAPGKTIKLQGKIAHISPAAESQITIDTPFTDVLVLKTDHDLQGKTKYAIAELLHGNDKYNLQVKVDVNSPLEVSSSLEFSSPPTFFGSGALGLNYQLDSVFTLKAQVSHNSREVALTSMFGHRDGSITIVTPFPGFTKLSLAYTMVPNELRLLFSHEQSTSSATFSNKSDRDALKYFARLTTPYQGFELLTLSFVKPHGESFSIDYHRNRQREMSVAGSYELSGLQSYVQLEIQTVYDVLRNVNLEFSYNLPKPHVKLLLTRSDNIVHTLKFEASADFSLENSTIHIDYQNSGIIFGPRSIILTATYDVKDFEKRLHMQLLDDNRSFAVDGIAQLSTASSYLTINVASPVPGYETLSVSSKALSLPGGPKLTFELSKNNQKLGADLQINLGGLTGDAVFEMTTPFTTSRHTVLSAKYRLQGNPAEFELMIERDSVRKTITGSVELSYTERSQCQETSLIVDPNNLRRRPCTEVTLDASLVTPFHGLQKMTARGVASIVDTTSQAQLILDCDRKQIKVEAFGQLGWSGSEVSLHITTPLHSLRTVGLNAGYDVGGQVKNASVSLFRNGQHFKWLTSGTVQSGAASGYMTIFTPFAAWKSVNYSAMYDLNQAEKQIDISYERNGKKQSFAARGMFDSGSVSMSAVTPFEGFETLGIGGHYVNNRVKREIGYDAHINHDRHRLYVLYEREGRDNVKLRLNTPVHGLHTVEIDLRRQSFSDGLGIYLDVNADGKRSSTEIRTSLAKTTMGIDVDIKSGWDRIGDVRLSGSVNLAKRKKAFRLKSESKKQKMELSGFYALRKKGGVGKLVSKLPIPGLEKVNVRVKIVTGKKNKLIVMYTAGGKKKKINGDLTFTNNGFLINLKTPYNGFQRIKANAGRTTGTDGKVSAELSLKRDNREISVKYEYIFSMKSGEGSIEIATPYEGFEDMRMSLTYSNRAKDRNMNFSARRNSRQWSIETSRSWATGTDETSLILSSPIEFIRSLKVIRSFDIKSLAAMTYHASYERNNRKYVISGKGSILKKGKAGTLEVDVNAPLEVGQLNANVAYDFSSGKNSLNAGITTGAKYVKLSTSLQVPTGSIKLTTSHQRLSSIDINYNARISELIKDVSATLTLADGRRLSVLYNMARRPDGRDASIKIESSSFGNREFSWSYTVVRRGDSLEHISLSGKYNSPNGEGSFDASAVGLSLLSSIKVDGTLRISSAYLTKTIQYDSTVDLSRSPNVDATATLTVDGRQYKLVVSRKQQRGKRILNIEFDGQKIQSLKITFEATAERGSLEGERSITISYGRGVDSVSILGKVNLGSSGKSGSLEVQTRKPSGGRTGNKEVDLKITWSFVEPNREIQANVSVDGRNYLAKLVGSRQPRSGSYVLEVSGPSIKVSRRKSISDIMVELSYDLNDGVQVKVQLDKPVHGEAEVTFKKSQSETILKTSLGLNDNMDLSPSIDNHQLAVDYRRMKTPTGSRFEISIDTTAFGLGKIDVNADVQRTSSKSTVNINYKRGSKTARVSGELSRSQGSGSSSFKLTTPIIGFEDVSLSGSYSFTPGQQFALDIDYSGGGKHFRLDASSTLSIKKAKGKVKTASSQTAVTINSLITKPVELSFNANVNLKDVGTMKQSATGEFEGSLNGKKVGINYKVDRDEHGRRIATVVLTTPLKNPYKKIVLNTDVSLHSNRAEITYQAGSRKASAQVSWFAGEAGQYGAELSLSTPYDALKTFEMELRGTRNRDNSIDVLGHYQRNGKIVHVTGTVHHKAIDLIIEVPWGESYRVEGEFEVDKAAKVYSVRSLVTSLKAGRSAGGEITVKATALNDMQLTFDVQTPLEAWKRINMDIAYTTTDAPFSRVIRVAFESPLMKRTEVSFELTNRSGRDRTNLRAGTTISYQSFVFTFWTHIFRDSSGMNDTQPDLLELNIGLGGRTFYGRLLSDADRPMDFLARLDGRSATVRVFHPDWRTLHFLVNAGPFKYRGHYVIGLRHLQAEMKTSGAGPPQRVQVSIDLESLNTISMRVTTNGGDGLRRSMVFAYTVEQDRLSAEFDISLSTMQRGLRCQVWRGREDWSSANAVVILNIDGLKLLTGEYDFNESIMMLKGSTTGVLFSDLALELRKTARSFKTSVAVDDVLHESYGSLSVPNIGVGRLEFGLQSPVLPIAPLAASALLVTSPVLESLNIRMAYGDLHHIARTQIWHLGERTTLSAGLDTPLFGLKDVSLALDTNGTTTDRTVSATMTAFEEVSKLQASATLETPYGLRINVVSPRLPAGNVKVLAFLDARGNTSLLANGSILSGNHETAFLCRYEMISEVSLENAINFHSTVWPVSVHLSSLIRIQDGFHISSKLKSSIDIISHYEANIDLMPDSTTAQYRLEGDLTTPLVGGQNLKMEGALPMHVALLVKEPAYVLLYGGQNDVHFYVASNTSRHVLSMVSCSIKTPNAQVASEVTLQWGDKWELHLMAEEPVVQFVPRLLLLSTDKLSDAVVKIEYGSNQIHILGNVQNQPELQTISFNFKSPFANYEEFGIIGRLENRTRKGIQAEIRYLGKVIGTNADFFLDGLNIIARASLQTPFEEFPGFAVDLTNVLDPVKLSYEGRALGRVGDYEVSAEIDGAFVSIENAHLYIGGVLGDHYVNNKLAMSRNRRKYQIANTLEMSTETVRSVHFSVFQVNSPDSFHVGLLCDVNSASVVNLEGQGILSDFRIAVENPWQPVALEWFYDTEVNTTIRLLGTWDLRKSDNNTVGINVMSATLPSLRTMHVETVFFQRTLSLRGALERSSTKWHNSLLFQIDGGSGVGYEILLRDSSQITQAYYVTQGVVKIPNRVISITGTHQRRVDLSRNDVLLQWDMIRFPEKRMGAFVELRSNSIWESWQSLKYNISLGVAHSALDHDVVVDSSVEIFPVSNSLKTASILRYTEDPTYDLLVDASFLNRSTEAESLFDFWVRGSQTVSGLNMTMYSSTVRNDQHIAQNVSFTYRNKLSKVEAFKIHALWDKPRRKTIAHLVTRLHDVSLYGTHEVPVAGVHVIRFASDFDGTRRPIEMRMQTRTPTKPMELRLDATYEKDRKLSLYAGMPTARLVAVRATRNLYGMHVDDASVIVRLNSSQLLSAVVKWRWEIALDVKRRAVARLTALSADAQSWLSDMTRFVQDEAARKERFIQPVINRKWAAVVAYTDAEYASVAADFQGMREHWRARYERDDLFMRTINGVVKSYLQRGRFVLSWTTSGTQKAFAAVRAGLEGIARDARRAYRLLLRAARLFSAAVTDYAVEELAAIRAVGSEFSEAVWLLVDTVQSLVDVVWSSVTSLASASWSTVAAAGSRLFATLRRAVSPLLYGAQESGTWVIIHVSEAVQTAVNAVSELVAQVKESLYEIADVFKTQMLDMFYLNSDEVLTPKWISSLPGVEFLGTVASTTKHAFLFVYESSASFIQYNQAFFHEAWLAGVNFLSQIPDDIPPVRILIDWLRRVYSETAWAWHYWEEGNQIRRLAVWIVNSVSDSSNTTSRASGLNITDNSYVKFFPADGFMQANLPLPVKWDNFNQLPKFGQNETTETNHLGFDIVYFYYELLDYINRISPLFTAQEWLPPYDARALVAGSQHYITFDDKFYEFAGGCGYLLAADLKQQSFALVVNYTVSLGRAERHSLSLFHGNHSLRLVRGRSLYLDDRRVELPFRLGTTVVSRVGSRTVVNLGHSRVECNVAFDVCTFQLSGRFLGRTGGLLGTYTNEPSDDFTGPDGTLFTRTDSFAHKWEVRGGRQNCRTKNMAIKAADGGNDPRALAACGALFSDPGSMLRPCFGLVNTRDFLRMCLNDLEAHFNSPGRYVLVCTAAAAYVAECATYGVDIWMPPQCVRCELEDGNVLRAAESKLYRSNAPRFADVVIVVERRACQRGKNFRQTMHVMDDYLQGRNLTNNRFAIIGYGGDDIYRRPHIETIKGAIWGNKRTAGVALDRVATVLPDSDVDHETAEESDVFEAVREACRLPFRGGVSKQIVLFSCSSCPYLEEEFPFTLKVLNLMDVTLHIVAETGFRLKKASRQHDSKVVALGSQLAYTHKDLNRRRRSGDELLRQHVRTPKDLCSPLAIETNGTVFDAGRWGKPMQHLVAEVVAEAADPSHCQECDCFADRDGVGKLECRTCISATLGKLLEDFEPDFSDVEDPEWFQDYHMTLDSNATDTFEN